MPSCQPLRITLSDMHDEGKNLSAQLKAVQGNEVDAVYTLAVLFM